MHPTCDLRSFTIEGIEESLSNEALLILVKKYANLKTIKFAFTNVDLEFFQLANEIKEERRDKEILAVECCDVNGDEGIDYNNEFPLIKLISV